MKNQNLEEEFLNHLESNDVEPYGDQWFLFDGIVHTFNLRNKDEAFYYRGWEGYFIDGETWALCNYWPKTGEFLFTYISHPRFIVFITNQIVMLLIKNKKASTTRPTI